MLLSSKIAIMIGVGILAALPLAMPCGECDAPVQREPELITVAPRAFAYRPAGEFTRNGRVIDAPRVTIARTTPLTLMRRQVTVDEYEECVREGDCAASPQGNEQTGSRPLVNVSWHDAQAYASWLSRKTGRKYRLPTDEEWAFAAGSRLADEKFETGDNVDPSKRWLARYEYESMRDPVEKRVKPTGAFGLNEHGLADMAGNVWEWTNTCFQRVALETLASFGRSTTNCGVRVVAGSHRSYMTDFIRDPRSGGCAVGVPPANLGFRLVRG
jgi:formylglycine-generating enzyme required for sulfatase activity